MKANILVDGTGHACLADFGLLAITSGATSSTSLNSFRQGGTARWMSPELFDPEEFDLKDSRQTKRSDCYALGMVIYEVLSRRVPFSRYANYAVVARVIKGKRPERPEGEEQTWFTDDIWGILEVCWKPRPSDRPSIEEILECLEKASRSWTPPSPRTAARSLTTIDPGRDSEPSVEESTDESEESSPSRGGSSQPLWNLPLSDEQTGNDIYPPAQEFSALPRGSPGHPDLETSAIDSNGSDSEESTGIPDRVSVAGIFNSSWY